MDNFDLRKYLAEGRLLKEELTPLQQYVYDFEKDVSGEDNAKDFLDGIKKLNTPKDVYDYYAFERNWEGDSDLESDLENIYNQVLDKFSLKEGEYTYMNDANTEFGPDVLDLDYDKIRHYIANIKGDDFANNFIDGYNDDFYENVVRFFDKNKNPTDEEVINFIDIEIEK